MCQKEKGVDGDGDGKTQGTCADATQMCKTTGECKCQKEKDKEEDGDGTTQGTCADNMVCCAKGECATDKGSCAS